jgi:SAM-dependent methyltransferase
MQGIKPTLLGSDAINKLIAEFEFTTVLDIGCGQGRHLEIFRKHGKEVTGIDVAPRCEGVIKNDFTGQDFRGVQFDCVWCCHVLEHQLYPHGFLKRIFAVLCENGILAITVPPMKHSIVGGHVSFWNAGLLLYHLILAGFDCREACVLSRGYNISVILRKKLAAYSRDQLRFAAGDIERLAEFFPKDRDWKQGFNGRIQNLNWIGK